MILCRGAPLRSGGDIIEDHDYTTVTVTTVIHYHLATALSGLCSTRLIDTCVCVSVCADADRRRVARSYAASSLCPFVGSPDSVHFNFSLRCIYKYIVRDLVVIDCAGELSLH